MLTSPLCDFDMPTNSDLGDRACGCYLLHFVVAFFLVLINVTDMNNNILVLRDSDGHHYLIGKDTISALRVRSGEHLDVINDLVKSQSSKVIETTHDVGLTIIGSFEAKKDRFLKSGVELARFAAPFYIAHVSPADGPS